MSSEVRFGGWWTKHIVAGFFAKKDKRIRTAYTACLRLTATEIHPISLAQMIGNTSRSKYQIPIYI